MIKSAQYKVLIQTFKKCHVGIEQYDKTSFYKKLEELGIYTGFLSNDKILKEEKTLFSATDRAGFNYKFFVCDNSSNKKFLLIGPFLEKSLSSAQILELGEKLEIAPNHTRHFEEYLFSMPVVPNDSRLIILLNTFLEILWNTPSFSIINLNDLFDTKQTESPEIVADNFEDVWLSMKTLEKRYAFENEMMEAVSLGQVHKIDQLLSPLSLDMFESRTKDSLRNAKNYDVIMNTLLRKATENGGVHPLYIDRLSSQFAHRIEQLSNVSENPALMMEMFRAYCRLVNKHSGKNYSPIVQKAVLQIDTDLSAELTASVIANKLNVSLGYLSTVFKKETGKTISEYVRNKRVKYAQKLLATTHLQVQTVALHCGILDLQYFTKIFKQETGKTPKQFREEMKNAPNN